MVRYSYLLVLGVFSLLLTTCALNDSVSKSSHKVMDHSGLTAIEAEERARVIRDVSYSLFFDFSANNESFSGKSEITFKLLENKNDLRIDFDEGAIESIKVNGRLIDTRYKKYFITLPQEALAQGRNQVVIKYHKKFSRDGAGLYRFVDPKDGLTYIYSDFEPYDANKVFPCFDQPNLKARYTTEVLAPKSWQVISSVLPNRVKKESGKKNLKRWSFPRSALFSTYVWSLHAGPYKVFVDKKATYPSRVFVRQSLKKYINIKDWHTFTRQSFRFFNKFFAFEYPFEKYDQILAPDFNSGAMENVGAVTFNERFINRGVKSQAERRRLANTIFHEMAHMWFGNLVTMDWWNDLWLNESFATYMANLGVSRATEFKETAWRDFNRTKEWAYWEDQLGTSHPIESDVASTSQAFAQFDGITYGKGASSLKQIHFYLGERAFRKGIRLYFKEHAYKNTTLKDFMKSLGDGAKKDLTTWQQKWLQTIGVNTISASYQCHGNKITSFTIKQSPSKNGDLRPHAFKVALLGLKKNQLRVNNTFKVSIDGAEKTIPSALGKTCPLIVYPNYGDHGYMRVQLDENSLKNVAAHINKVKKPFLEELLWTTLWDMVYYGQYSYLHYLDIVLDKGLEQGKEDLILARILRTLHGRRTNSPSVYYYLEHDQHLSLKDKTGLKRRIEDKMWTLLSEAKGGSERQKILFSSFLTSATTIGSLKKLEGLLLDKVKLSRFKVDQDKRWEIIARLNQYDLFGADRLMQDEQRRDSSNIGKMMTIKSMALIPDVDQKKKWIDEFLKEESSYTYAQLRAALNHLFPREQSEARLHYSNSFYRRMREVNKTKSPHVAPAFATLVPTNCTVGPDRRLNRFIQRNTDLKKSVRKRLRIALEESERCRRVLQKSLVAKED